MKRISVVTISSLLALSLFVACLAEQPLTVEELLDLGEKFLLEHDYEQALVHFQEVIEIEPMNPRGYTGAAEAFMGMDRIDDAEAILRVGISTLPGNPDITQVLSGMYVESGKYDEAMELIGKGLLYAPNHPELTEIQEELVWLMHTHSWEEANCHNPRTCPECDETEGEPLEHVWLPANFQEPQICSECGDIEGEPLVPGVLAAESDPETYEHISWMINENELVLGEPLRVTRWGSGRVFGEIVISDYRVFESDEDFDAKEGYEYHAITYKLTHYDARNRKNALYSFGPHHIPAILDTYTVRLEENEDDEDYPEIHGLHEFYYEPVESDIPGFYLGNYLLNYYGDDFEFFYSESYSGFRFARNATITAEIIILAPAGYDGLILGLYSMPEHPYFRLQG